METSVIIVQTRRRSFLRWLWDTTWNVIWFTSFVVLVIYMIGHA